MTSVLVDLLPSRPDERTHTLADRRSGECKWPRDVNAPCAPVSADHSGRKFCCDPVEPGKPYCPGHCWDAYPRTRRGPRP